MHGKMVQRAETQRHYSCVTNIKIFKKTNIETIETKCASCGLLLFFCDAIDDNNKKYSFLP